jgi:hypothetical protein
MTMATQDQQGQKGQQGQQNQQRSENRSENLLPGDDKKDGRYDVAEEVNLDQQGDMARRVGKAPKGIASSALADSLRDDKNKDGATS